MDTELEYMGNHIWKLDEITMINLSRIKNNPKNPRIIKDLKFLRLVESIKKFPKMLQIRPIVIDENQMILGGNMRHKACKEIGFKAVPVIEVTNLSEEEKNEFVIKDNVSSGEWDWDMLANDFENTLLNDWGLDVWVNEEEVNLDDFFTETNKETIPQFKIILEYSEEEYNEITELFKKYSGTKENIIFELLKKQ